MQIQIEVVVTFRTISRVDMNILFIVEVKILMLSKRSYQAPILRHQRLPICIAQESDRGKRGWAQLQGGQMRS